MDETKQDLIDLEATLSMKISRFLKGGELLCSLIYSQKDHVAREVSGGDYNNRRNNFMHALTVL